MLKYLFSLSLLIVGLGASAQNDVKKANKILNQVSKNYKSLKTLKATFEIQISEPGSKKPTIEKGTLYLKGSKFKVELAGSEIVCNGKTQWYWMKDVCEIQITNYNPSEQEISPSTIFTMYEKGFKYRWLEEKTENGKQVEIIELVPKEKQEKKEYTKIKLTIDKTKKEILSSEIFYRSGRIIKYKINEQTKNLSLADTFFEFDVKTKKDCTVVDLR